MIAKRLQKKRGITLVELLAGVVVIGIIAAMAAPNFDKAVKDMRFRTKTKELVSQLRLARSHAIAEKVPHGVYFDYSDNIVILFQDINDPEDHAYEDGSDSLVKVDTLSNQFNYLYSSFSTGAVVFQPNGTASESGFINLGAYSEDTHDWHWSEVDVLASTGRTKINYIHNNY